MPPNRTADFELIVGDTPAPGAPAATRHAVQVSSPAGPAFATIELDLKEAKLKALLSAATAVAPALELRQEAGAALFDRLFRDEVAKYWYLSIGTLKGSDVLRVR